MPPMASNWWCGPLQDDVRRERLRIARNLGLHRFSKSENGQMMLLTAFVLVIGFVALTAMVARLSQLSEGTRQAADRPIYIEAEAVAKGVQSGMEELNLIIAPREDGGNMDSFNTAVDGSMQHLTILESARGYRLRLTDPADIPGTPASNPWCELVDHDNSGATPDVANVQVAFSLGDPTTSISFTISYIPVDIYWETTDADDYLGGVITNAMGSGSGPYVKNDLEDSQDYPVQSCSGVDSDFP